MSLRRPVINKNHSYGVAAASRIDKTTGLFYNTFTKEPCKRDYILHERPIVLPILPTVATPYSNSSARHIRTVHTPIKALGVHCNVVGLGPCSLWSPTLQTTFSHPTHLQANFVYCHFICPEPRSVLVCDVLFALRHPTSENTRQKLS